MNSKKIKFMQAAAIGNVQAIKTLTKSDNENYVFDEDVLKISVEMGHFEVVKFLIANYSNICQYVENYEKKYASLGIG